MIGKYPARLDEKNRLFVPAKLREKLGSSFVITKDIRENCLKVYSYEQWDLYIKPLREQKRKLSERIFRYLHASMADVTPDSQGRVLLTPDLVKYADLEKGVVIIGCGDYVEIWSEDAYDTLKNEENIEDIREELEEYGL